MTWGDIFIIAAILASGYGIRREIAEASLRAKR